MTLPLALRSCGWLALLAIASVATADSPTTQESPAERARLDRGEQVRQVLAETSFDATRHDGNWPARLAVPRGVDVKLTYERPQRIGPDEYWKLPPTIVLYESLDDHPDGVWVGYADGHLEFAPDKAAFEADRQQLTVARRVQTARDERLRAARAAKAATTRSDYWTRRAGPLVEQWLGCMASSAINFPAARIHHSATATPC
jgi:hypothetical protein